MTDFNKGSRIMNARYLSWCLRPAWLAVAAVAVFASGCSSEKRGDPNGRPVSGTVTYNGAPVAGASVTFRSPTASAFGITDAEGKYKLTTAAGDKVSLGQYQVSISKKDTPPPPPASDSATYVPPDPNAVPVAPKDLLPPKYADAATSQLTASVTADGKNEFDFPLTD